MALTFTVGTAADVFTEPHASHVRDFLTQNFGDSLGLSSEEEPWYSGELGESGWRALQQRAGAALGASRLRHFLSMEAWKGVYLPVTTEPGSAAGIPGDKTPLDIASLLSLSSELTAIAGALGLALERRALQALAMKYREDAFVDRDMDVQTFVQLSLAVLEASERGQPLWVVK